MSGTAQAATTVTWGSWKFYHQEKSQICWAAAAKSVVHRVKVTEPSQCTLVNAGKNVTNCPNVGGTFTEVNRALSSQGVTKTSVASGTPSWANLRTWTTTNGGAITGFIWANGSGHAVPVAGTDAASTKVYVVRIREGSVDANWFTYSVFTSGNTTIWGQKYTISGYVGAWR